MIGAPGRNNNEAMAAEFHLTLLRRATNGRSGYAGAFPAIVWAKPE